MLAMTSAFRFCRQRPTSTPTTGRRPAASVNFLTAHDGFTLADLVSYDHKHNHANGDGNRDGESHNRSWNCGVEGPTGDPGVLALRRRQRRNLLATLMLSQGVPLLLGGDELGRTQRGNNNAYCHDSELSWYDWSAVDAEMLDFTRRLIALRRAHPVFMRRDWFHVGVPDDEADGPRDIEWCGTDGTRMGDADWHVEGPGAIAVYLSGERLVGRAGQAVTDDSFYLVLNATAEELAFTMPDWLGGAWACVLDTAADDPFGARAGEVCTGAERVSLVAHSLVLARRLEET